MKFRSGHTLVEMSVVMVVLVFGIAGSFAVLDRGASYATHNSRVVVAEGSAHRAMAGFLDGIIESRIGYVDTTQRVHNTPSTSDVSSDRFHIPGSGLVQCSNIQCAFHTRPDLSRIDRHYDCGYEFCSGGGMTSMPHGKSFPPDVATCSFDGSPVVATNTLDGVRIFVARDPGHSFMSSGSGTPSYRSMILFFPYFPDEGLPELRRYEVSVSDLLATPASCSPTWSRFSTTAPTMVDLFDFGTDGTTNGTPDGSVPVTAALSDATTETFTVALSGGEPAIFISKSLGTSTTFPHRSLILTIRLRDGLTTFAVAHFDSLLNFWVAYRTFTRAPTTIVEGLTEFAVSTAASHPFNTTSNPTGVLEANSVRVTLGTSSPTDEKGKRTWSHHIDRFTLSPRN